MSELLEIREADARELGAAAKLLAAEGWSFEVEELERLARLGGTLAAFDGARLLGFLTYVDHAPVRWVGNVAVSPDARGRGVGARLVDAVVDAPGRGIRTVGLYSVEKAVTLYARAGFTPAGEAWAMRAEDAPQPRLPNGIEPMTDADLPAVFRLDRAATGMDRRALLGELFAAYPEHGCVLRDATGLAGYGFAKPYADVTELGPVVATGAAAANAILDALLAVTDTPHEATVLGANAPALAALQARGFERRFRTVVMFKGPAPAWTPASLVVAAGLEKS